MTTLNYTKAIKNGRLKTTEMEIGTSFQGTVKGFEEGKYGKILVTEIAGREVKVSPSGNLKRDINDGKITEGSNLTVTRVDDVQSSKGFSVTQYEVTVSNSGNKAQTTREKLQAIRSGQNS